MPVAYFLLFLVPGRQKINILGIGRDKSQSQYFTVGDTKSRGETERQTRVAKPPLPLGAARVGPCLGRVWPPWLPPSLASSPIRSPRCRNPRHLIKTPRNRCS